MKQVTEKQAIKFTDDEMSQITEFKTKFSELTAKLGEVEVELIIINSQLDSINKYKSDLKSDYIKLRESEIKLASVLKDKYGEGELDIETGVFIPKSQ